MTKHSDIDSIVFRVIGNTKRRKRPNNIIEIANDIRYLLKILDGFNEVAEKVGISAGMLKKFLNVEKLTDEVKKYFSQRIIDSVTIADLLSKFRKPEEQIVVAHDVIDGKLNADDLKALVPLYHKSKTKDIDFLINKLITSKDVKIYVIKLDVSSNNRYNNILLKNIESFLKSDEILDSYIENNVATIELTKTGKKQLSNQAKLNDMSLKNYIIYLSQLK